MITRFILPGGNTVEFTDDRRILFNGERIVGVEVINEAGHVEYRIRRTVDSEWEKVL